MKESLITFNTPLELQLNYKDGRCAIIDGTYSFQALYRTEDGEQNNYINEILESLPETIKIYSEDD